MEREAGPGQYQWGKENPGEGYNRDKTRIFQELSSKSQTVKAREGRPLPTRENWRRRIVKPVPQDTHLVSGQNGE